VYLDDTARSRICLSKFVPAIAGRAGHNGSGKTTLLRMLYGDHAWPAVAALSVPASGPAFRYRSFKRKVGIVAPHLQSDHPQELTVAAVVQSGRHASIGLNDAPNAADRSAANRSLEFFGLADLASRTLRELFVWTAFAGSFARAWDAGRACCFWMSLSPAWTDLPIKFNGPCRDRGGLGNRRLHDDAPPLRVAGVRHSRA